MKGRNERWKKGSSNGKEGRRKEESGKIESKEEKKGWIKARKDGRNEGSKKIK